MDIFKDFELLFKDENGKEIILTEAEKKKSGAYTYYEEKCAELSFSLLLRSENEIYLKIQNETDKNIAGFAGVRFKWENNANGFTLIPGIYYNGNYQDEIKNIPHINLPESPRFEASLSAASIPALFTWDGEKTAYHYESSLNSPAGWNGISLDAENKTLTFFAPAYEERVYKHIRFKGSRKAYVWHPGEIVCFRLKRNEFGCESISSLYEYVFNKGRVIPLYPAFNKPRVNEEETAGKVRDWMYKKHCVHSSIGTPMILNAFDRPEDDYPYKGYAEWNIQIGWCSGTMSAFPLLKYGGKYRDFAIEYIDFLSENGDSPSGVKRSIYDGERWVDRDHPEFAKQYDHCRLYSDYIYYLGKCIALEKENGFLHENWEKDFKKGIGLITSLWEREKDFGHYWNVEGETLTLRTKGTGAGAFCLLALTEGLKHYPESKEIKKALEEAAVVYYERNVITGRCNAGPLDILRADDSESIAALTNAYVNAYLLLKDEKYKEMAIKAGHIFASWVLAYPPHFPGGSILEGINVCGGVLANVQNRHIGPGICTNSAKFLRELYEITEDKRWYELYSMVKAAALNCVCMYDGELFGNKFNRRFLEGMVTEQINITDALNEAGETWCVSASWPATAVLLGYTDQ